MAVVRVWREQKPAVSAGDVPGTLEKGKSLEGVAQGGGTMELWKKNQHCINT